MDKILLKYTEYNEPHESRTNNDIVQVKKSTTKSFYIHIYIFGMQILNKKDSKHLDQNDSDNDMEDESATEMDSNHPPPSHHQTHRQHHLDIPLNDSKKRTNNNNQVLLQNKRRKCRIFFG
jgi:hypothetical protein